MILDNLIVLLAPLFFLVLFNLLTVMWLKRGFLICMPVSFCVCGLLLYYSQFVFGSFVVGYVILALLCIVTIVKIICNGNDRSYVFGFLFDQGGVFEFSGIYLAYFLLDFKRHFTYEVDEYMHWGKMVRQMDFLDRFY